MGGRPVHDHNLTLGSNAVTPTGSDPQHAGMDLNFVLNPGETAATLRAPNGLHLTLATDQPCLQVYTAPNLRQSSQPLADQAHVAFGGICLEPQGYPDAPNRPEFPSIVVTPDHPYRQRLDVSIAARGAA